MSAIDLQNAMSDMLLQVVLQQKAKTLALRQQQTTQTASANTLTKVA